MKKTLNKNIFIAISLLTLCICTFIPFYNMLIKGVYSWHIRQPEFIEGGLEIVIFIIISFFLTQYNRKNSSRTLLACGMLYLSLNGVIIPFVVVYIYFEIISFIGSRILGKNKGIIKNFITGISVWLFFAILFSLINHGTINELRIITFLLLLVSLLKKTDQEYKTLASTLFCWINRISNDKKSIFIFTVLIFFIFSLVAKTNTAIDYDSIWYGLRPEHVLVGENSFYDYLGYSAFVYYYPKLMELFYLPISGLGDYSFIITANIFILIFFMTSFYELVSVVFKKNKSYLFKISFVLVLFSIPAIANIATTAKPDIMGALFTFLSFSFFVQYINNRDLDNIYYSLISIVMLTGTKLTYLLWGGVLFVAICIFVTIVIKPGKNEFKSILSLKNNKQNIEILFFTIIGVLGVHYRTLKLTGYPLYPILIDAFNKIGFKSKYPFKSSSVRIDLEFPDINGIIYRVYQFTFDPNNLGKVIMLWTSSILFYLIMLCMFKRLLIKSNTNSNESSKDKVTYYFRKFFKWILLFYILISIYYASSLESPDGNYFIIPIVFSVFILFYYILECDFEYKLEKDIIKLSFAAFILLHLVLSFVSHSSWSYGTKAFSSEIVINNYETSERNKQILEYNGIYNISNHLEEQFSNRRVISSAFELTMIDRIDAPIEAFNEIGNDYLSNGIITETYEKFCEYIGNANIKGFLVLSDDNSIFKDYVYEYIAKAGYSYKIEDKKGIFYCIN